MSKCKMVLAVPLMILVACQPTAELESDPEISFEVSFSAALTLSLIHI